MNFVTNQKEQPAITIENPENYWVYLPILRGENINLEIGAINRDNWQHHYDSILNILRDAIETDEVQWIFEVRGTHLDYKPPEVKKTNILKMTKASENRLLINEKIKEDNKKNVASKKK